MEQIKSQDIVIAPEVLEYIESVNLIGMGKLFSLLNIEPTPMQENIIDLFDNKLDLWNHLTLVASRRSGKSLTGAVIAVRELLIPNSSTILISSSAKTLSNLFNDIVRLLKSLGLKPDAINSQSYYIKLGNSYFRGGFSSAAEGVVGNKASLIILDEAGLYQYHDFAEAILYPMRLDYKSYPHTNMMVAKVVRMSSPRGLGSDFHIDYVKGLRPVAERVMHPINDNYISKNGYVSLKYSIYDSPLTPPKMIESLKESTDEMKWKNEYLAEFTATSAGTVFNINETTDIFDIDEFMNKLSYKLDDSDRDKNIEQMYNKKDTTLPLFIGLDIGTVDPTALVIGTVIENIFYVLDTFAQARMTTVDIANMLKTYISKWENHDVLPLSLEYGALFIDPAAKITRTDLAQTHNIDHVAAYNRISEGVDSINTLFQFKRIKIASNLGDLIEQIKTLAYKESAVGKHLSTNTDPFVKHKHHHYDLAHAFRYLVASTFRQFGLPEIDPEELYL